MILLTRLNGPVFALNPDLVERADCTPDTVITLVDGTKYLVTESLPELIGLIRQYRAGIIADAQHLVNHPELLEVPSPVSDSLATDEPGDNNVLPLHRREH